MDMKSRPVMKVVRLPQDMLVEPNAAVEDDKAVYEMLDCWYKTNAAEKVKLIAVSEARRTEVDAVTAENGAKISEMTLKYEATLEEYQSDWEQLQKAIALRMKETQEFHTRETELITAIKAALLTMKPSTSMAIRFSAARPMAPTMAAISRPPN